LTQANTHHPGLTKIPSAVEEANQLRGVDYTQPFFAACQGTLQQEKIDAKAYTHADREVTWKRFVPGTLDRDCDLHNLLASEELFHWMKSEGQHQARLWIIEGLHKKAFNSEWALSSRAVTYYGFQAVIALLISLFLSFYLYMSLNLSNLRGDAVKLSRWCVYAICMVLKRMRASCAHKCMRSLTQLTHAHTYTHTHTHIRSHTHSLVFSGPCIHMHKSTDTYVFVQCTCICTYS